MANPILDPEGHASDNVTASPTNEQVRPFDLVELPSKGKLYAGELKDKTHVEVFYLTAKEEDILTSPNMVNSGKMFEYLLKSVFVNKNIDPSDLLLGDRNTLLTWLRTTGYGSDYNAQLQCTSCNGKFEYTFNLAALDLRYLTVEPDADGTFDVFLPVTKKTAKVCFLTAREDAEVDEVVASRSQKLGGTGNPMTEKLRKYIKEIDGVPTDKLKDFSLDEVPFHSK